MGVYNDDVFMSKKAFFVFIIFIILALFFLVILPFFIIGVS